MPPLINVSATCSQRTGGGQVTDTSPDTLADTSPDTLIESFSRNLLIETVSSLRFA
jgi:hypothetical protein